MGEVLCPQTCLTELLCSVEVREQRITPMEDLWRAQFSEAFGDWFNRVV